VLYQQWRDIPGAGAGEGRVHAGGSEESEAPLAMQLSPFSGWVVRDIHSLLVDAVFHSPVSKFVSHVLPCSFLIFPMSILGGQACMRACVPTHASTHPGAARREGQRLNRVSRWTFQDLETNDLNSIPFTNTNASKFAKKKPRANKHKRKRKNSVCFLK
jgi:hypothetical protein